MSFSSKVKAEIAQVFGKDSHCRNESKSDIIDTLDDKRAYVRTAFMSAGSVNGPGKAYHLEFTANDKRHCLELSELLREFSLSPKSVSRKGKFIVYFKDGDQIAEVLNIIGAHKSLLEFENNRAEKDVGNSINRIANCETANIDKSILAAIKQIEDIKIIVAGMGLDALDVQLHECAVLRLNNPELNLAEIGQKLSPPIGKSGVNHRFRRIAEIAAEIAHT